MRFLLNLLLITLLPFAAVAQSQLPECRSSYMHNCFGSYTFPGGNKYVGEWMDGKPSGQGTFTYPNDKKYVGEWKDGRPNGQGTLTFPNGNKYVGEFKEDNLNGQGTFTYPSGSKYVGEFKADKFNGQGTYTYSNGNKYVGEFKEDKFNGQGTYYFLADSQFTGSKYVGEFKEDKRHGQGIEYNASGSINKQGHWENGNLVQSFAIDAQRFPFNSSLAVSATKPQMPEPVNADLDRLVAMAQSQLPECTLAHRHNCIGTETYADGNQFVGEYKDGKRNGLGTYTFASGLKFVGQFKDDKPNGLGTYTFGNGSNVGVFKDDRPSGLGTYATASTTQAPVLDPVKADRDRLAADLEASRKKQQELEEQLRVAQAAPVPNIRPTPSVPTERRVALVIGNAAYKVNPLKNPVNDSNDMARSLRAVGFDVIEANNTTLAAMREATRRFADKLVNSDVGLVYYSGHGVEVKGKNYLIPVNADIKREYEVVDQAFDASQFLEMMDSIRGPNNKRVNILLVDACRNNELQKSWRTTNNGLARMDAPGGTFISFATAPGRVAADGVGRNSPYTKHLLQALKQPNMPIEQVFKVVRRNVMDETKGEQVPWDNSSLVGDFFFTVQR